MGNEGAVVLVFEDHDGANRIVVGIDLPHARDEDIQFTGAIHVGGPDVSWSEQIRADDALRKRPPWSLAYPTYGVQPRLTIDHVQEAVFVQVDNLKVGDDRIAERFERCADRLGFVGQFAGFDSWPG